MEPLKRLVLVRHGESEYNVADHSLAKDSLTRWDGARQPDIPLTERGRRQAHQTGEYLKRFRFHRVLVSPYLRAMQTAELITQQFAEPAAVRYDERIRERELGAMEGLTAEGMKQKYPDEFLRREKEGPYYYRAPGGESYPDVSLRVHSFLTSLRQNFAGKEILVVCHGVVMWSFRRVLERMGELDLLEMQRLPEHAMCNCLLLQYEPDATGRLKLTDNRVCYKPEDASNETCQKRAAAP